MATKKTTSTAKKTAPAKKAAPEKTAPEPMDPEAPDEMVSTAPKPRERNAYALDTLVSEVTALFPDAAHEVSGRNGWGVALDVTFEAHDEPVLMEVLPLLKDDARVSVVDVDPDLEQVVVEFHADPRIQDSRDPFNLDLVLEVYTEGQTA